MRKYPARALSVSAFLRREGHTRVELPKRGPVRKAGFLARDEWPKIGMYGLGAASLPPEVGVAYVRCEGEPYCGDKYTELRATLEKRYRVEELRDKKGLITRLIITQRE